MSGLADKRILLAEDEFLIALTAEDALVALGAVVIGPAYSLATGLTLAAAAALDGAVLDVNLNGEDSRPVAELLARRCVPFVLATGYDRVDNPYAAPVVAKPYDEGRIDAALRRALAGG
ncbi:MAG: response regulator [Alphaproteobacteria bacterium]|nr:response regulator [Alphaproteobacteria bacterium]